MMDLRPTDHTPYLVEITTHQDGQPIEPVSGHTDAEEAAAYVSEHPELTEVLDPEHGWWYVWLPNHMTKTAWSDGLYLVLQTGGYQIKIDYERT